MIEKMAPGEWFVFGFVSILFFGGLTIYIRLVRGSEEMCFFVNDNNILAGLLIFSTHPTNRSLPLGQ